MRKTIRAMCRAGPRGILGAPVRFKSACGSAPMHRPHDGTGRCGDRDQDRNDALAGERWRAAIVGEDKGFARIFSPEPLDFGRLFLRSRQYEVGRSGNARVSDQAKSAIRVRICAKAVSMNDLHRRAEHKQQQTDNSEKLFSEELELGLDRDSDIRFWTSGKKMGRKYLTLDGILPDFVTTGQPMPRAFTPAQSRLTGTCNDRSLGCIRSAHWPDYLPDGLQPFHRNFGAAILRNAATATFCQRLTAQSRSVLSPECRCGSSRV